MEIKSLQEMYRAELKELRSMEEQVLEATREMAEVASNAELREAFLRHHQDTLAQQERLDDLLQRHRLAADTTDDAMAGMLRESQKMMAALRGDALRDAGVIASAQLIEHYEIAAYGTAAAHAGQLGLDDDQKLLHEALEQETQFDAELTDLAKRATNPAAAKAA